MTRAKTPDPVIEEYASSNGRRYTIEARRDGAYLVRFEGVTLINQPPRIGASFGAPRWPSIRFQQDALREAKQRADSLRDEQH
jgi:hypothetical protein